MYIYIFRYNTKCFLLSVKPKIEIKVICNGYYEERNIIYSYIILSSDRLNIIKYDSIL